MRIHRVYSEEGHGERHHGRGKDEGLWREGNGRDTSAGAEVARRIASPVVPNGTVRSMKRFTKPRKSRSGWWLGWRRYGLDGEGSRRSRRLRAWIEGPSHEASGSCAKESQPQVEYEKSAEDARRWKKKDAKVLPLLKNLMRDEVGGDPISGVRWSRKSTRKLAGEMARQGHPISRGTVGRLLGEMGLSLKANVKNLSGRRHPDREEQFQVIGKRIRSLRRQGAPILSVDTKKREIIANYANAGRIWRKKPIEVDDHDFPSPELGRANPFGIYDVTRNRGRVVVGTSAQTASFAVDALAEWYRRDGRRMYPDAREVLILCDNGGCNGSTNRLWKYELQQFADEFGMSVHVSHYPPGASKWNPIEHRLFSFISKNWAGQPLTSYEKVLNYIRTTKTQTGLEVRANLLTKRYEKGIEISDEQMKKINLRPGHVLSGWNYTIRARRN